MVHIAHITVSGVRAAAAVLSQIPAGIAGAAVTISFSDPIWDGLTKTAVFRASNVALEVTRDVLMDSETVRVPHEVTAQAGLRLLVGVYGVDAEGNEIVPTLWADLGPVRPAADPSGDPGADPSLPIWAVLQEEIRQLKESEIDEKTIRQIVDEYLEENPPAGAGADGVGITNITIKEVE